MVEKKGIIFLAGFLFLITIVNLVAATDVAYILKEARFNKSEVLSVFSEMNLSVELVADKNILTKNLSKYKLVFVDDAILRKTKKLPIYKYPSVIMNSYYGPEWGLTDSDGISQLISSSPLQVKLVDNGIKQVYTQASFSSGVGIPYYYLGDENKANFQSVARTYTGNVYSFGDVIAVAPAGIQLINGKISGGKICFYGIAETKYWTSNARQLFKDCVGSVLITCYNNSDCNDNNAYTQDLCINPATVNSYCQHNPIKCFNNSDCGVDRFVGNLFCGLGGNVYQNYTTFTCNLKGTVNSSCSNSTAAVLNKTCSFGCSNGACLPEHNPPVIVLISPLNNTNITNPNVNFTFNVTDESSISNCSLIIDSSIVSIDNSIIQGLNNFIYNLSTGMHLWKINCTDEFGNTGTSETRKITVQFINCSSNSDCIDGNVSTEDICVNPGTIQSFCTHNPIKCFVNSDCGIDGFVGNLFCGAGGDVYRNFTTFTCNFPGTSNSSCSNNTSPVLNQTCDLGCVGGECVQGVHDVGLVNFTNSTGGIRIEKEGVHIINNTPQLLCNQNYTVRIKVANLGNFIENITFNASVGSLPINYFNPSILNSSDSTYRYPSINFSLLPGFYNITVNAIIPIDNNLTNNLAIRQIEIICPIICTDNDQDGYNVTGGSCGLVDCNDSNLNIHPGADDSNCNGIDENCNLIADEGYIETPTNCGLGICANTGLLQCINGNENNSCIPGLPNPQGEICNNQLDDDCDGLIDEHPCTCNYNCFVPSNLGDTTAETIGPSAFIYVPEIPLQQILNSNGYSLNAVNDQTNIQIWNCTGNAQLEIKYLAKETSLKHQVFGYYLNSDNSTFTPIFETKNNIPYYVIPLASIGQKFNITIPAGNKIGFAIHSFEGDYPTFPVFADTGKFYTENSLNPGNYDHVLVYDLCNEFVLGFEDLPDTKRPHSSDYDYNDLVVSVKLKGCS